MPATPKTPTIEKKYGRAHCDEILDLIDSVVPPKSKTPRKKKGKVAPR